MYPFNKFTSMISGMLLGLMIGGGASTILFNFRTNQLLEMSAFVDIDINLKMQAQAEKKNFSGIEKFYTYSLCDFERYTENSNLSLLPYQLSDIFCEKLK